MIGGHGVIWLTLWTAWNGVCQQGGTSGYGSFGVGEHFARKVEHSKRGKGLGEEDHVRIGVVSGSFAGRAQNQNRQVRHAAAQLV